MKCAILFYHYLYLMSKLCEFCAKLQNMKVFLQMLTNQNCFWLKSSPTSSYMFVFFPVTEEKQTFSRVFTDIDSWIVRWQISFKAFLYHYVLVVDIMKSF